MAHDLPHLPSSVCLVSSWAVVLPPSGLKHSPDKISVLEVDMEMRSELLLGAFLAAQTNLNFL